MITCISLYVYYGSSGQQMIILVFRGSTFVQLGSHILVGQQKIVGNHIILSSAPHSIFHALEETEPIYWYMYCDKISKIYQDSFKNSRALSQDYMSHGQLVNIFTVHKHFALRKTIILCHGLNACCKPVPSKSGPQTIKIWMHLNKDIWSIKLALFYIKCYCQLISMCICKLFLFAGLFC